MKSASTHAVEIESEFLAGVQANLGQARGRLITGTIFKREDHDFADRVRAAMVDRRIFDRDRFAKLPHNRGFKLRGFERRWLFGRRLKSVTVCSVIAPPGPLLESDADAPPVTLAELSAHVRELVQDPKVPHVVGVCSPSGFDEDVWRSPPVIQNVRLVLVEPRGGGGWRISRSEGRFDEKVCRLFDPEGMGQKLRRVRQEISDRGTDLLMGGLSAESMARKLDLPADLVRQAFALEARTNPELRVSKQAGDAMLYRGAPSAAGQEDRSMSISERIRNLFSRDGDETRKINELSERRAALSAKLDRLYDDIGKLEQRDAQFCEEGKASKSTVVKRRLAGQIARVRQDISRCNTTAALLSKQINIISTHIHNLELARTGSIAQLPTGEELTAAAVTAEEMLEQLTASDELVSGLEVSMAESAVSEEEAEILKELEGEPAAEKSAAARPRAERESPKAAEPPSRARGPAQAE